MPSFSDDVATAKTALASLPTHWDGKQCVMELKAADFQWRQMEWWAFYFEFLCHQRLRGEFKIPGELVDDRVTFDLFRSVNWDLKAKAIKSDDHRAILNDRVAMERSIQSHGEHGVIVALCDVEYNDEDRSFQQWHTELKGGPSSYEKRRAKRTSVSRYRKTSAVLSEILFLRVDAKNLGLLEEHRQGRNSNDKARPTKFMIDLEDIEEFLVDQIPFAAA